MTNIWNKESNIYRILTEQIRCDTKETLSLFNYIETNLQDNEFKLEKKDNKEFKFSKKIRRKNIFLDITDMERDNLFEIEIYSQSQKMFGIIRTWSRKQFLGLTYGLWGIIVLITRSLIPVVILLASRDDLSTQKQLILRVLGIVLICSGIIAFFVYFVVNYFISKRNKKIRIHILEIYKRIVKLVSEYESNLIEKKICWKCFEELQIKNKKCPKCGTEF